MVDTGKTTPTGITGDENTVGFMLSRVLSGGSIYRKTELASLFPRWISDLKENKLLSPRLPELLARVLRPFGTPNAHQCIEELEVPKSFPAAHQWMSEIQILIDDKADERFLQNLECLPDRVISFEELCQQPQDSTDDFLVIDPNRTVQFDYDMRKVMTQGDKSEMRNHPDVFYVTGSFAWTVRSPYWNIALATDDAGNRFLSNDVLDRVLPKWRHILSGDTVPTAKYGVVDSFRQWLESEHQKVTGLGKPWIEKPARIVSLTSKPKSSDPRSDFLSRLRSSVPSRTSPFEVSSDTKECEQTEVLREILTELQELKSMIKVFLPTQQEIRELAIPTPEVHIRDAWEQQQSYPPLPESPEDAMSQPSRPQDHRVSPQVNSASVDPDWEQWNGMYHTPTHISIQGSTYIRRT